METLPWRSNPADPGSDVDRLEEGGHISDRMYSIGNQGMDALVNYIKWFRAEKQRDPNFSLDWVGRELVYSEFQFEAYNKTPITKDHPAGGMSYSEREDTIRHQNIDRWILRYQSYGIHKKFHISLLEFLDLEYPVADWLVKRAGYEEEDRHKRMQKAEEERKLYEQTHGRPAPREEGVSDSQLMDELGLGEDGE